MAFLIVIIWGAYGPFFIFLKIDNWLLVQVQPLLHSSWFLLFSILRIKKTIKIKLNELIAANKFASNRVVNSEDLTEKELELLKQFYKKLSESAAEDKDLFSSHLLDEAEKNQYEKTKEKVTIQCL